MGGSAQEWSIQPDASLAGASEYELNLVMTKFDGPGVTIGYEILVEG